MSVDVIDVSTLTVAGTSVGISSASPTKPSKSYQAIFVVQAAPCYVRFDGDAATSADTLLNVGDVLPILADNPNATLDNIRFIRKTNTSASLIIIWYNREAVLTERIIRGSVRLVTEGGDSLADDTADAIKVLQVNAAGTELSRAEDSAHTSSDNGLPVLGVRSDAATGQVSADGDYAMPTFDRFNGLRIGRPVFGEPTLVANNNAIVRWDKGFTSPLDQKGSTGWLARLYGGVQTNDDWARVNIPVDELLLTKFTPATLSTQWTYWLTDAESFGVNIVFWVHDPTDFSKRAEITQLANVAGLAKAAGWNKHILSQSTTQFFWYGENITGSGLTAGTQYTLAQFLADVVFSTYTIYRITIEYGWESGSNEFANAWVADIQLNGIMIPLLPSAAEILTINSESLITHTQPVIAATTTAALAANTSRNYALFINDSDEAIYLKVGADAVMNQGIRLNANGGSFEMSRKLGNLSTLVVNGICTSGSKVLLVAEGV